MLVEEAIRSRASIKVFSDEPVAPAVIERCLEAAVWAPNHHLTEPWQFRVIAGEMRELLARTVKASMLHDATGLDVAVMQAKALKERRGLLSAPAIVTVYSDTGADERATRENFAACAAAVQNILIMAHSAGLAGIWRSSRIYELPRVRSALRVHEAALFVGAIFLGYSLQRTVKRRRTPAADKTYWLQAEDFDSSYGDDGALEPRFTV